MVSSAILELILLCCDLDLDVIVRYIANSHLDCLSDPLHQNVKLLIQAVASGSTESSVSGNRSPRSPAISQALSDTPNNEWCILAAVTRYKFSAGCLECA